MSTDARILAQEAYIFGYPLVIMDVTRQVGTAVPKPEGAKAPVNQLAHLRTIPDYTFTDVVTPNADTLYSVAMLDLKTEPVILSVPAMESGRYYLMQLMDAWTNVFAAPGTRTTGNGKGDFAIIGPRWAGSLPAGVQELRSPTNHVWMIGRTQTNGKGDYAAVHAIQDQYRLTPLSAWGSQYTAPTDVPVAPGVDMTTPPVEQVGAMDAAAFFGRLNALMADNPPAAADAPALAQFAAIGIAPGKPFDLTNMDAPTAQAIQEGYAAGQARLVAEVTGQHGRIVNGWQVHPGTMGAYGTDYVLRAVISLFGLGANLSADAVYPHANVDADGQSLTGTKRYVLRFAKGQLPPVNAFWSLSMYNAKQFFIQNPIDRYAIGDRDALQTDADGTTPIYIQHESPGSGKESNWLPAPPDSFNIVMRLYWPKQEILDGTWKMPPIELNRSKQP
jgi:hypothetical protein